MTLTSHTEPTTPTAATIGFFDGVHLGHRHVVDQLKELAASRGLSTTVITFDRHPLEVVRTAPGTAAPPRLTTDEERRQLLAEAGVDRLAVLPFGAELAALTARQFMHRVLSRQLGVRLLLTGYDNHFGHRQPGSSEGYADYVAYGRELGMEVVAGSKLQLDGGAVSSSLVRRLLADGLVEQAARCLGRPYALHGIVVAGEQQGRRMGFPTANLRLDDGRRMVPRGGVYAVRVQVDDGGPLLAGITNIGTRPTFGLHERTIETHILHFSADLYGRRLGLHFVARLRDEQHFDTPHDLAAQLRRDAEVANHLLTH